MRPILLLVVACGATGVACADMVQVPREGEEGVFVARACDPAGQDTSIPSSIFSCCDIAQLCSMSVGFVVEVKPTGEYDAGLQPMLVLCDRQDSLGLCLYALFGLGLCKSAPWVKKVSLGVVPGWYHDGGPFRIGHSSAISPDCLCLAFPCFQQPEDRAEDLQPIYCHNDVGTLWRASQFSPAVIAPRGPPSRNHESPDVRSS